MKLRASGRFRKRPSIGQRGAVETEGK